MRAAPWVLAGFGLAACELVIGGEDHATVRPRDGAVEVADANDAAPDATRGADSTVAEDAIPDHAGPPGPCMPPPPCLDAEQVCESDCSQQYATCMSGYGDHGNKCMKALDDCTEACESTCVTCAACPDDKTACMVKGPPPPPPGGH
jgi:hypothetical protein